MNTAIIYAQKIVETDWKLVPVYFHFRRKYSGDRYAFIRGLELDAKANDIRKFEVQFTSGEAKGVSVSCHGVFSETELAMCKTKLRREGEIL